MPIDQHQPSITDLKATAHWVNRNTIIWDIPGSLSFHYNLHFDPDCSILVTEEEILGGQTLALQFRSYGPDRAILEKFPHLTGYTNLTLRTEDLDTVPQILKGQFMISARDASGALIDAATIQIPGVLDDLYFYDGPLGVSYEVENPVLRLWAPTARSVSLHLYSDPKSSANKRKYPMTLHPASGVWAIQGKKDWNRKYYLYEVEVYVPSLGRVVHNMVTDPYSISLSMNSRRSQIVDLFDPALMPSGWQSTNKPPLDEPEDIVIYELHVRDFSIYDVSVPPELRGKFLAFTQKESHGMSHLKSLARAGLTHVHLLPVFDLASIEEDESRRIEPDSLLLASLPGDSTEQQAIISKLKDRDGFNWGYDPFHFTTPEGSYSTKPDGPARILEFRQLVQSLNSIGLRVVMDVVYNHTFASGQSDKSVLDKVVPGYYYRLNHLGMVENSSCCANTASEHAMMEKLMIDSLVTWATAYKIDGFRFDLMGHHMIDNMLHVRQVLDDLTILKNGVDGKKIYIYGEGWNFGEVSNNYRGLNAAQMNIAGTGIGVFNDRLRDAVRGGNPFSFLTEQGIINGLFDDPNASNQGSADDQKNRLLHTMDWLRLSMAGNLKEYRLRKMDGWMVRGIDINYNGIPAAYTANPQENVIYVSAHDNNTLFDSVQLKAPLSASMDDRVRMNNLGIDVIMLSQGVPFFHAGDDLLRSKSLDSNSYNSGDWFNRLDFTYESNNWAVGLPPNQQAIWPFIQSLLANPALKPNREHILAAAMHFQEMLKIRRSSILFRLRTAEQIIQRVRFYNTGYQQIPGLVVMSIANPALDLDQEIAMVCVLINASQSPRTFFESSLQGIPFELHPVLAASYDAQARSSSFDRTRGAFTIPGRTTGVFLVQRLP